MRRVLLVAAATILLTASTAVAKPIPAPPTTSTTTPTTPTTTPTPPSTTTNSGPVGVLGGTDILQGLGATDANCAHPTGQVVINCKSDGFAASAFPPSNYGLDVNVDRGLDHPEGWVMGPLMDFQSTLFTICAYLVAGIVMLLSVAVSFDPFRADQIQIAHILNTALGAFTWPLITLAVMGVGAFTLGHLFKRQIGRGALYVVGSLGAILLTTVILANVGSTLGWIDDLNNGLSSFVVGTLSGSSASTGGFAQSESTIWGTALEQPWCVAEFGSAKWCMSPISPAMAQARNDVLASHMDHVLGNQDPAGTLTKAEKPNEIKRLAAARTNGELFLSFVINSDVRNGKNDKWTFYSAAASDPSGGPQLLTIRGPGGFAQRFMVMVFGMIAGAFFILTLLYITWQVATAALWFIMMLIAGCVTIFMVAFGETGMKRFVDYAKSTGLALIIKVVYLAYLGILLAATGFVLLMNLGWFIDWMLLAAVWSIGFFKRKHVLEMLSFGNIKQEHNRVTTILTTLAARRVLRRVI